jgi:hypothetical protein
MILGLHNYLGSMLNVVKVRPSKDYTNAYGLLV